MRTGLMLLTLASSVWAAAPTPVVPNRAPLQPNAYNPLPLTSVKPKGWLLRQMRIQADGLSGHLDEFWPDLGPASGWLGGKGESWERGPYFLDGLLPLAYLLDDPKLIAKARKWVDWTLDHQRPDGAIGPPSNQDWWPNMVMLKVLTQYQEATGDARVIPLMQRYFAYQARTLDARPLEKWAAFRWQDEVLSVLWLYNRTGDAKLLDLAHKLHSQGHDWEGQFRHFLFTGKVAQPKLTLATHVVNNAMALKTAAVWWLVTGAAADREALYQQFREMDRYHLLPNGIHSGDEHYAGRDPSQGSELCSVVEAMFSLENILAATGDAAFADRLEKITFNPLPGTFSADMWSHQYDQQPNQVLCTLARRNWTNNGPDSNLFGLEPNFGCCTSNLHQGWPKFAASLWMAAPGEGLAAVAYAPSEVTAKVRGGVAVTIREATEYPFRDTIRLTVSPESPVTFPLELRIPAWARGTRVSVNGQAESGVRPGSFFGVERSWRKGDVVELVFPMQVRTSRWYHNSVAVERGPLVYSLRIAEEWRKFRDRPQAPDWEVYPTSAWNYALLVNPADPAASFQVREKPVGEFPFSPAGAPVELVVKGRRLPEWQIEASSAGPLPESPVQSKQPEETLTLVPYGSAKLRITAFPWIR